MKPLIKTVSNNQLDKSSSLFTRTTILLSNDLRNRIIEKEYSLTSFIVSSVEQRLRELDEDEEIIRKYTGGAP